MKKLLMVTSFLEGATGLALMTTPSLVVSILLSSPLSDTLSILMARVAGSALFSLAMACWFLRKNPMIPGLIFALMFYNIAAVGLLGFAALYENLHGNALWPTVAIHIALATWCAALLFSHKNK